MIDGGALSPEDLMCVLELERPACAGKRGGHPAVEPPRVDPHERHAVPVPRIHVGLYLKDLPAERRIDRASIV
jgi:hypothetical protein